MPAGSLHFLRPLYDIARWQYLLMSGKCTTGQRIIKKVKMVQREHEIIAQFLCKLLSLPCYDHLIESLDGSEDTKQACGYWKVGERPTKNLVRWYQDQWRRMRPILNYNKARFPASSTSVRPSLRLPCCHMCGALCQECAQEIGGEIPRNEMECRILDEIGERESGCEPDDENLTEPIAARVKRRRTDLWTKLLLLLLLQVEPE